jgi:hypothetical protein
MLLNPFVSFQKDLFLISLVFFHLVKKICKIVSFITFKCTLSLPEFFSRRSAYIQNFVVCTLRVRKKIWEHTEHSLQIQWANTASNFKINIFSPFLGSPSPIGFKREKISQSVSLNPTSLLSAFIVYSESGWREHDQDQ